MGESNFSVVPIANNHFDLFEMMSTELGKQCLQFQTTIVAKTNIFLEAAIALPQPPTPSFGCYE